MGPVTGNSDTVTFTGLSAGDYTLYVWGCGEEVYNFTITNGAGALKFDATPEHVTVYCTGATTPGYIALNITNGGTLPYKYRVNGSTWETMSGATDTIKAVREGTYTIEVMNGDSCIYTLDAVRVERKESVLSLGTVQILQQPTCNSAAGIIMFYPTGGSGLYDFQIRNTHTGNYATGGPSVWIPYTGDPWGDLAIGTYRVIVRDRSYPGCTTVISPELILRDSTNRMNVEATPHNASTCDAIDGYITAVVANKSLTSNLNYELRVYQSSTVIASGTFPPNGIIPAPPPTILLGSGSYSLRVSVSGSDACGAFSGEIRIGSKLDSANFFIEVLDTICATCPAGGDGLVRYVVSGKAPYQLQHNLEAAVTINKDVDTIVASGLDAGRHFLRIWGKCGEAEANFTVPVCSSDDSGLRIELDSVVDVRELASGVIVRGQIHFKVFGNTGPYSYTITGGESDEDIIGVVDPSDGGIPMVVDGLLEGIFKIEVTDANGCCYTLYVLVARFIEVADLLDCASMTNKNVNEQDCGAGYNPGTSWDVADDVMSGLDSVAYYVNGIRYSGGKSPIPSLSGRIFTVNTIPDTVMVVGYLGTHTDTCWFAVRVAPLPPVNIGTIYQGKQPTCGNNDGSIVVSVSGGNGTDYRYSLNGGAFNTLTGDTIKNLPAGKYVIRIIGSIAYMCDTAVSAVITLSDSSNLAVRIFPEDATDCITDDGALTVATTGGKPMFTYYHYILPNGTAVPATLTPSNKITGLYPGTYKVSVTDGNGCTAFSDTATIRAKAPDLLDVGLRDLVDSECGEDKGQVKLWVETDLAFKYLFGSKEVSYEAGDATGGILIPFSGLKAGKYSITVFTSCGSKTVHFTIENCQ